MERSRLGRAIRALDAEIRAVRIREAVARGSAWASEKVKAGAALVRSIPQRRQEAKAARVQRKAAGEWEAVEAGKKYAWTPDHTGAAPLHRAAEAGRNDIVDRLIKAGAIVNYHDNAHATPLHRAAEAGHAKTIDRLIQAGADLNAQDWKGRDAVASRRREGFG